MKKRTPMKTNDIDENDLLVCFLQNLFNHITLLFCGISDTSNNCMFVQVLLDFSKQKVRFAQVLAFLKVAKN